MLDFFALFSYIEARQKWPTFLPVGRQAIINYQNTMAHTVKKMEQSQTELTITVTPDEYKPYMEKAATRLSDRVSIKGFRKGKAPYDKIVQEVGEMTVLQEAMEDVVKKTFYEAVLAENLETIGMPQINVEKLAPDNDIVYKAVVALMPTVTLPDLKKIEVKHEVRDIEEKKVDETLDAIRGMHATEVLKDGAAEGTDKLMIDMDMLIDNVPVEGGQAKDYQVYLSEQHYIPGFNEHVTGLKKGDKKEFTLDFPKEHYQKHLAGKTVDFKVSVKDVYERQLPELSDELAKKLGQESIEKMKELIRNNMYQEEKKKADQKVEIDILEQLIEKATIDDIPDVLIDAERQRMFYELKRDLDRNGIEIAQYLSDIKKTEEELYNEFKDQATKRAKAALISRQVAKDNELAVDDAEIDREIESMREVYKDNTEYLENLKKQEVRDSIATTIQNRKVMLYLKGVILGEEFLAKDNLAELGCQDCKDHTEGHKHEHGKKLEEKDAEQTKDRNDEKSAKKEK